MHFVNSIASVAGQLTLRTVWVRNVNAARRCVVRLTLCTAQAVHFCNIRRAKSQRVQKRTV